MEKPAAPQLPFSMHVIMSLWQLWSITPSASCSISWSQSCLGGSFDDQVIAGVVKVHGIDIKRSRAEMLARMSTTKGIFDLPRVTATIHVRRDLVAQRLHADLPNSSRGRWRVTHTRLIARDRWIRTVGISPPLPLRPAPCMSCRVEASAEAGGGAGTSGCAGVRESGDTADGADRAAECCLLQLRVSTFCVGHEDVFVKCTCRLIEKMSTCEFR